MLVDLLRQTRQAIEQVEQEFLKLCYVFSEYEFVISIPGFGPDVNAKVLAYIGDQYRFETASQVLKMAGFDLCAEMRVKTGRGLAVGSERFKKIVARRLHRSLECLPPGRSKKSGKIKALTILTYP